MTIILEGVPDDPRVLRDVFACHPSGVAALCAMTGEAPAGMVASSFTSVSMSPPLVSVCIQKTSATWRTLGLAPRIGISILGETHAQACYTLASKAGDRFKDVEWSKTDGGAVFIDEAAVHLDCLKYAEHEAGDHIIVVFEIVGLGMSPEVAPLIFHGSRVRHLLPLVPEVVAPIVSGKLS